MAGSCGDDWDVLEGEDCYYKWLIIGLNERAKSEGHSFIGRNTLTSNPLGRGEEFIKTNLRWLSHRIRTVSKMKLTLRNTVLTKCDLTITSCHPFLKQFICQMYYIIYPLSRAPFFYWITPTGNLMVFNWHQLIALKILMKIVSVMLLHNITDIVTKPTNPWSGVHRSFVQTSIVYLGLFECRI